MNTKLTFDSFLILFYKINWDIIKMPICFYIKSYRDHCPEKKSIPIAL